ncbi:uncharacterized protein BKA55DRAFT_580145 [Fusarium redolens]|uniref:Uncharacterized protein n=1 Tax=Fusarium redolens TaxID=48865 RepID=A0A9P9G6P8_FUSRE|nr:uncharacterized protein BKA55DRAFT_580145 [Fusarium redolens]KAH7233793.1 hypothetical protein BKA55DRAFT_580145 [Fusarium redolens]
MLGGPWNLKDYWGRLMLTFFLLLKEKTEHMEHTNAIRRKLVIIGDSACGKTSLLSMFTLGNFPAHYVRTITE